MKNEIARREIESLDYYLQNHTNDYSEESHTAMMMAIHALEQEPCDDAISRQAVLNILDDVVKDYIKENDFDKAQGVAWVKVQKLPSVTPKPKTGRWIRTTDKAEHLVWECDKCSWQQRFNTNYCPNCGCAMKGDKR